MTSITDRTAAGAAVSVRPANRATWSDIHALFGSRGQPSRCWCQRFRMLPKETWHGEGPHGLAHRLRDQTACEQPDAPTTWR